MRKYSLDSCLSSVESNLSSFEYVACVVFDIIEVRTPEQDTGKAFRVFRSLDRSQAQHPVIQRRNQCRSVNEIVSNFGEARSINSSLLGVTHLEYVTDENTSW
jgi:hypothetical protein